jgi:hypothetical protein
MVNIFIGGKKIWQYQLMELLLNGVQMLIV